MMANERSAETATLVERLVAVDGSAAHGWPEGLVGGRAARRDLGDAVHALGMIHGHYPGLAEEARARAAHPAAEGWLEAIAGAFAGERARLAALVAAVGPLPSTPGHAESEAALLGQRHALEMLARSDRCGCAIGAVAALVLDWPAIRRVLDRAAATFGFCADVPSLPSIVDTVDAVARLSGTPGCDRAVGFGAQQLLAQHRGLWTLLEARAEARG